MLDALDAVGFGLLARLVVVGVDEAHPHVAVRGRFVLAEEVTDVLARAVEGRGQVLGEVRGDLHPVFETLDQPLGTVGERPQTVLGGVDASEPEVVGEDVQDDQDARDQGENAEGHRGACAAWVGHLQLHRRLSRARKATIKLSVVTVTK